MHVSEMGVGRQRDHEIERTLQIWFNTSLGGRHLRGRQLVCPPWFPGELQHDHIRRPLTVAHASGWSVDSPGWESLMRGG